MSRRGSSRRARSRRRVEEDINPMSYISNLSDVMLILAVGIMLSLIIHWNVNLNTSDDTQSTNTQTESQTDNSSDIKEAFTDDDLEDSTEIPDSMERLGDVYYDAESGTYYIAKDSDGANSSEADNNSDTAASGE